MSRGIRTFGYCYSVYANRSFIKNKQGHIRIRGISEDTFFCGAKNSGEYQIEDQALPGRELCPLCVQERDRIADRHPTDEQVQTWWKGGMVAHRRELESLIVHY